MLRSLPLISVRQQADETRHAQPFALARRDELVEQHLRTVGKITELGFPQCESAWLGGGIAVLETEDGLLGEHRIEYLVAPLWAAEMIKRGVTFFSILIEQHRVALGECPP